MKKKARFYLALVMFFAAGVVAGGIAAPDLSHAHAPITGNTCEKERCEPAPWWKFWAADRCASSGNYLIGCDVVGFGCQTYECYPPTLEPPGDPEECRDSDGTWICF